MIAGTVETLLPPRLKVTSHNGEQGVVASHAIRPGERIMLIEGELSAAPSRYSIQVERDRHIEPPADAPPDDFLWRFLNHSCRPNAVIVRRVLVAIEPIRPGDQISFDYNTTEYEMASPFRCHCGHCDGGEIRGFRFLTAAQRQQREHFLESHLHDAREAVT